MTKKIYKSTVLAQAQEELLAKLKNANKKKATPKSERKPMREQYKELREEFKAANDNKPIPLSYSERYEEELKKSLFENAGIVLDEEAHLSVSQTMETHKKTAKEWDVLKDDPIRYFDPSLSYELTGYRPISMEEGLDFDPAPFQEMATIYNNTGKYTEYPQGSKMYNDFWKEQYRRCQEGYTVGKYTITGDHYFFINFYRMETVDESARASAGRSQRFPSFLAKQYEFFHYVALSEICKKDVCILKARGLGLSEIVACLAVRPYVTNKGYRSLLTAASATHLEPLKNKCWTQLNWLDLNTGGGMKHVRLKVNNADTKRASRVTPDGVEFGWMSEIDSVVAEDPKKIRGDRVDRLIFEESGSNKHLIKSWVQGNALVELGGIHFGSRITLGCVCAGTKVWTNDGRYVNIEDLHKEDGIVGFSEGKFIQQEINWFKDPEKKECVRINTNYGSLECSEDHPIYTRIRKSKRRSKEGLPRKAWYEYDWIEAKDVMKYSSRNVIGICDKVDIWGEDTLEDPYLIGALIGDGSYGHDKTPRLSSCDEEIYGYAEQKYTCVLDRPVGITSKGKISKEIRIKGITQMLHKAGIYGQTKTAKRLPTFYRSLTKNDTINLLAGLFDTDGTVTPYNQGWRIAITQSSREILEQMLFLLNKLGIYGKIYKQEPRIRPGRLDKNPWYNLYIEDAVSIANFADQIPLKVGYKKERLVKAGQKAKSSIVYRHYMENKGIREAFVSSVESIGKKFVYNLNAAGSHTYLANNFITHNTGGDDMALEGLSTIFQNPEAFNILPYKNIDTEDGKPQLTAFFLPAHRFSLKQEFLDNRGVTDHVKFKAHYVEQRKKLSGKALLDYCAEHCFIPNEALYKQGENMFDSIMIADRLTQVRVLKEGIKPRPVSLLWKRNSDDSLNYSEIGQIKDDPRSKLIVFEEPLKDDNGQVFKNLYVAGIDSIDQGSSDSATNVDVSDFCIVIKRRVFGLKEPKYVAIYKDRPSDIRVAYDTALKLLTWYNCKALLEHTKISIITYFKEKKRDSLFMKRPRATLGDMRKGNSQMLGVPATEYVIKHGLELINNFVNDYCYGIDSDEMLEQLLKYSWENKRKFDIIASMTMAEIADEDMLGYIPKSQNKSADSWQDVGYYTDERGYKKFGVIPKPYGGHNR